MAPIWEIVQSELVWGIVIGILLSFGASLYGVYLNGRNSDANAKKLIHDLIINISRYVDDMEDVRNTDGEIKDDHIVLIGAETSVYFFVYGSIWWQSKMMQFEGKSSIISPKLR